jgi:tetratricopeptide (TPR) repeat protein
MRTRRLGLAVALSALITVPVLRGMAVPTSETLDVQLQQGASLAAAGRYLDALPAYLKAAQSPDPKVQFPAQVGVVRCSLRTAQFVQARSVAASLMAAYPEDADVRGLYGDALWSSGLFDVAEKTYRDTLALKPDSARAHNGLAKALLSRGRFPDALDHAEAAVGMAPGDPDVHHTAGLVFERLRRYNEAVAAYGSFVDLIPGKDQGENATWARAKLRALRAFGRRTPYEVAGPADQVNVIPFRLVNEKVVVTGRFNGGPEADIVIDTGAELPVVSRSTAERRGIVPISYTVSAGVGDVGFRSQQVGLIDQIYISGFRISNLPCIIRAPSRDAPGRETESFSPLAAGLSMSLDYRNRRMTIARRLPAEKAPDFELPLWLYRLATVHGVVGKDTESAFVVDTGGEVISISTSTVQAMGLPTGYRRIPLKVYGLSGWDTSAFLLTGMRLAFDDLRFDSTPLVVLNLEAPSALLGFELGGTLGYRLLSKYRTSIDLDRSVLRLTAQ